jgi:hypothetical protein
MNAPSTVAKVSVHDIHAEGLASGSCANAPTITSAVEDNGVPAAIEGIHTACQILYDVQIDNPTNGSPGGIHLTDLVPYPFTIGMSTMRNAIYDLLSNPTSPYTSNGGEVIGEYDIEQPGNFLNPAGNSNLAGSLALGGTITSYNGTATIAGGVPSQVSTVDLTGQSSGISGATAYAIPSTGAGDYEALFYVKITQAASGSSTLGPVTIGWTDPVDSTTPACEQPSAGLGTNTTTTQVNGICFFRAKQGTNSTYGVGYNSSGTTTMKYKLDLRVVALY